MGALTRIALGAAVLAAAGVAAVLVVGRSGSQTSLSPSAPVVVRAGFEPATVSFGDPVSARVVVLLDRGVVRPETLKLTADVAPLTQLGPARTTRTTRGRLTVVSVALSTACLTAPCAARPGATSVALPRVTAVVARRDGGIARAGTAWPALEIHGRVNAADLAATRPPFRADTSPPAPTYRIAPSTLAALLDALAVLLVLGAVGIAAVEARRLVRRRRAAHAGGELERALRLAREAESRAPPDRRRAVGLLARLLDARDPTLAEEANELAWARPQPEPETMAGLVAEVEREVPS